MSFPTALLGIWALAGTVIGLKFWQDEDDYGHPFTHAIGAIGHGLLLGCFVALPLTFVAALLAQI